MPVVERNLVITNKVGLHARPARLLVQTAALFHSQIVLQYGAQTVNAKSIVGVLRLGARCGSTIHLRAEGEDAEEAVRSIEELVQRNFDEEEEGDRPQGESTTGISSETPA
ncbi:phosphocarrier protein HPr [Thermogemmatispora aurantia]|uniref:Phosphocarrier protein HPr n=1 Tax=Thermogemmatispora aurantia TaxID=2045279 RepID=A0A5J4KHI3_9CHLR|nr:HPr family phosphocarrier protein [Thermogemmatispora aurantia]GER85186.1 phosphocarrier protein HPr [Thermogemmatispora aurantia]